VTSAPQSESRRVAVVTGTTSGIGQAVARLLIERGWHVLGVARRPAQITHPDYEHIVADLADTATLSAAVGPRLGVLLEQGHWNRVGLVNNAAHTGLLGPIERLDVERLPAVLATNLIAPIWFMREVLGSTPRSMPLRIVNLSTGAAVRGFGGLGAYGSSKAALRMAGMVLAAEIEETRASRGETRDVSVLSFEPGTVDTPMQENARTSSRETLPSVDVFTNLAAEGKLVDPVAPATDIVGFLEGDGDPVFSERRYGAAAK
jgi:benzil reductase ((S)-benzoin forming)